MRRITLWIVSTVAALVLLFSYRTSTSGPGATATAAGNPPGIVSGPGVVSGPQPTPSGAVTPDPGSSSPPTPAPANRNTVVNGAVAQTRWGPVQVQVTISAGRITEVTVLRQPDGNRRDVEINSYALPQLTQEVLTAQSAQIDMVSGATVTSQGYIESLQAALDAVHFGG
jgi:uncharacterized protein with FMN-binding domain